MKIRFVVSRSSSIESIGCKKILPRTSDSSLPVEIFSAGSQFATGRARTLLVGDVSRKKRTSLTSFIGDYREISRNAANRANN